MYVAETDLSERTGLGLRESHRAIELALVSLVGVNQRFGVAQKRWAITGFDPQDGVLVEEKLDALARRWLAPEQIRRFDRVMLLAELPDLGVAARSGNLNVSRLLEVRNSDECRRFRDWLASTDTATDQEIEEEIRGLRQQLALAVESLPTKAIRWMAVKGASVKFGPVPSWVDKYLVDRILPRSGPAASLSRSFQRVYQLNPEEFLGGDVQWKGPTE